MRKIIGILVILVGIGFLALPLGTKYYLQKKASSVNLHEVSGNDINRNKKFASKRANYDGNKIESIDPDGAILNKDKADMSKLVGQLVVPSIKMNIAIFEGLDNNNLYYGAATMKANQRFGSGNYAIAGHYTNNKKVLFGGLMDIKRGAVIRTTDKTSIYEYIVYKVERVHESRTDLILDKEAEDRGKPIISLMTCYYNESGIRYFVVGELERIYNYRSEDMLRDLN